MLGPIDLTGQKFNRLSVVRFSHVKKGHYYWECICECGANATVESYKLKTGKTKSCGCLNRELTTQRNIDATKHGLSRTRIYGIWRAMIDRCHNTKNNHYYLYGANGIKVCEQWLNVESFYDWAINNGYADDLTIDRIENSKDYCPENCRWATVLKQASNKRNVTLYTVRGITSTLPAICNKFGMNYWTVRGRIKRGWPVERALDL